MEERTPSRRVAVRVCDDYAFERVYEALKSAIDGAGGLHWVTPGMKIAVKANLMIAKSPDRGATVHPNVAAALCRLLTERGASVVVGDSPGGLFTPMFLSNIYSATGIREIERYGATLNTDFSQSEQVNDRALVCKTFACTNYLLNADAVICLCKIKTHGFMAYTGAVKNFFGIVPGLTKAEYHYRFPMKEQFSGMLVDLCDFIRPRLSIADAIDCMEGNGPSAGSVRHVGALFASENPHALDLAAAHIMTLTPNDVPTLKRAVERGLIPDSYEQLSIDGDLESFVTPDFKLAACRQEAREWGRMNPLLVKAMRVAFDTRPNVSPDGCVRCGECARICPAHAITIRGVAEIDRDKCIRCFCCQEFCPKGAISVRRPFLARLINR